MSNSSSAPAPIVWPVVVAALGVFAIFLVIVGLARTPVTPITASVNIAEEDQWRLSSEGRKARRLELQKSAQAAADSYGWINEADGIVRLPVDRAIDLTLAEIKAGR
ncbi:MAG: hypothetical protein SynsKO_27730 [Synoicihabitans sp.]